MLKISKYSVAWLMALAGCTEKIDFENDVPQRAKAISQQQVDAMMAAMDSSKARETYRMYTQGATAQVQKAQTSRTLEELKREKQQIEKQIAEISAQHKQSVCQTCHRAFSQENAKAIKPKTVRIKKRTSNPTALPARSTRTSEQKKRSNREALETVKEIENVEMPLRKRQVTRPVQSFENFSNQAPGGNPSYNGQQARTSVGQESLYTVPQNPNSSFGQAPMMGQPPVQPIRQQQIGSPQNFTPQEAMQPVPNQPQPFQQPQPSSPPFPNQPYGGYSGH